MERIYFTLSKILYPENLTLHEYASSVKKLDFARALVSLYAFQSGRWIEMRDAATLTLKKANVLPSIYVVWSAKATKKTSRYGVDYETSAIDDFCVFPLDHMTKSGKTILQYLREDHPKVLIKDATVSAKQLLSLLGEDSEYVKWIRLHEGMTHLSPFGFSIVNSHDYLLRVLDAMRSDPERFVNDHVTQENRESLHALLRKNPFAWKLETCCNLIALLECKIVLTRDLYAQAAYVEYSSLVDQVLCALETSNCIVGENGIVHYHPERAIEQLRTNLTERWSRSFFVIEGDTPKLVYLASVAEQERTIAGSLSQILENAQEMPEFNADNCKEDDASSRFIRSVLSNRKTPYHLLHGPGGSGKTYTITQLVNELLLYEDCNVGCFGFMGKTAVSLKTRVVEINRPRAKSYVYASTIDSFLAKRTGITIYQDCSTNAPPERDSFNVFLSHLRFLIVDEIGLCERQLLAKLLQAVRSTVYKVIFVGDYHQILSIGPGNCMYDLMTAGSSNQKIDVVFELLGNKRAKNSFSSIAKNAELLYSRPSNFSQRLIKDMETCIVLRKDCDMVQFIENQYRKHGASNVQIYTRTNRVREKLIQEITSSRNHSHYFETRKFSFGNFSSQRSCDRYLPIGTRIMVTKNTNGIEAQYCAVDLDLVSKICGNTLPSTLEKLCNYRDPQSGLRIFVENAKVIQLSTPYVCNGEMDTVRDVQFVFRKTESNAIIGHAFLYTLGDGSKQILVGQGGIPSDYVVSGICTTVCKMQGSEAPVCIFIVDPTDYKMNYRELIVAFTRARERLLVVVPAMAMLQQIVNTDGETRKSLLYEKLNKIFIE